ncbi:MAG: hypothetical protein M1821_002396 [Bathelium mastoideum]|nr:MAG: hypothetical protein M1821_002396 [Bathelium mastoideum]KAI9686394.1 MAG: hypothetical protein M1822_003739 [Bathelium mastoideum]
MVHLSDPQPDTGHFTTLSVRPAHAPSRTVSRPIRFPRNHYSRAPNLAAGFSALDLAPNDTNSSGSNGRNGSNGSRSSSSGPAVRANLVGHNITATGFALLVETWGGAVLRSADAAWIEHAAGARECQFGQFDTRDVGTDGKRRKKGEQQQPQKRSGGEKKVRIEAAATGPESDNDDQEEAPSPPQEYALPITFPRPFAQPPTVVVWLNRIDLGAGAAHDYRVSASATQVTSRGFLARLDTWGDGALHGAALAWIAFPADKRRVASGVARTADVRSWGDPRERTSGWVSFPGKLYPPPRRKDLGGGEDKENTGRGEGESENGIRKVKVKEGEEQKPKVLIALKMLDMAGNADLRIKTYATDVTREGFRWHLDTWDDSTLYAAEASWIAMGFA